MNLPFLEQYDLLLPRMRELYEHTNALSWQMLLPLFLVSIAFAYTADLGLTGTVLTRLKRLVLVALLLVCFPMISEFIQTFGVDLAKSIDNMSGIDAIVAAAGEKAKHLSFDPTTLLRLKADFLLSCGIFVTYLVLLFARYFLLAFQHFYWFLFIVLGPFLILCSLFEAGVGITRGLFKNMIMVGAWPLLWAVLSAFFKVLPFGVIYKDPASLFTVITLNLIVAVALLFSPFLVSQICEGVNLSIGEPIKRGALKAAQFVSVKTGVATEITKRLALTSAAKRVAKRRSK
jgi:hypothetical protein